MIDIIIHLMTNSGMHPLVLKNLAHCSGVTIVTFSQRT